MIRGYAWILAGTLALFGAGARQPPAQPVEEITVQQAALRIQQAAGHRAVIVFYKTNCPLSQAAFPSLVALARQPGPMAPKPSLRFIAAMVAGPLTISRGAAGPAVQATPCRSKRGSASASTAYTEDLDFLICNAADACDDYGNDLTGAAGASVLQPETFTSGTLPAADYVLGVWGFNVDYAIVYKITLILQ